MKTRIAFFFIVAAAVGMAWTAAAKHEAKRLVLAPQQRLELTPAAVNEDSLCVDFTVTVAPAQKYQRHRCVISANRKYVLKTAPLQRWALRGDTLMVLSEIDLTLRVPAAALQAFEMKFDFVNLDAAPPVRGTVALVVAGSNAPQSKAIVKAEASAPAIPPSAPAMPDTSAKATAKKDTSAALMSSASDSATGPAPSQPAPNAIAKKAEEQGQGLLWVLFALLLLGIALIALLNVARKMKSRAFNKETQTRSGSMAAPAVDRFKAATVAEKAKIVETPRPDFRETNAAKSEPAAATTFFPPAREKSANVMLGTNDTKSASSPDPEIDLFADVLPAPARLATPAVLQTALDKLRDLTAETQKALAVQCQALEQFSRDTENVRGLLLEKPAAAEEALPNNEAQAAPSHRNGRGRSSSEPQAAEPPLRLLSVEEKGENVEELANAIDSLIAASTTKPLAAPAAVTSQKIDSLRRIASGLQELVKICRALSLTEPLAQVESLARKVLDLQLTYETWLADQSVKLSFSLPRPSPTETPAAAGPLQTRREIVEALVNNLHETRKIAVQGPIYFVRRVTQLLEYDLPKLRYQLKAVEDDEMRKIWDGML